MIRFIPLLGPAIAWAAARLTVILAFAGGVAVMGAVVGLVVLPVAKDRAYETGHAAGVELGKFIASWDHAVAMDRARATRDDRTARQIEDRTHAETAPSPAPRPDGLRCGPFTRDCPDPPAGSPR